MTSNSNSLTSFQRKNATNGASEHTVGTGRQGAAVDAHVQTQFARPASREVAPRPASGCARLRRRRQW